MGRARVGRPGTGTCAVTGCSPWRSSVALPLAAKIVGSGDQITHMAATVGYGTFLAEHLLFGLALGLLLASRRLVARP
mgnify:CR=1 FL=1